MILVPGQVLLRRTRSSTECDFCGKSLPRGGEHALVTGEVNAMSAKLLPDTKLCGLCAGMLVHAPSVTDDAARDDGTVAGCLGLVDSGNCDAACILAATISDGCECRCSGEHHGALRLLLERGITADDTPTA